MTPHLNEAAMRERIHRRLADAERLRAVRTAKARWARGAGHGSLRQSVGHGLIALGTRLVDSDQVADRPPTRRAA